MYKIVNIKFLFKKYLYFNDLNFFMLYEIFLIIGFSHAIRLVKSGRQFVYKVL